MSKSNKILISEIESLCSILVDYSNNIKEKTVDNFNMSVLLNCIYDRVENLYLSINNN